MSVIGWEASAVQCAATVINACPFVGMDKLLSACLWLIPNRFGGQELAAEACQAVVGMMRVCYESIAGADRQSSGVSWAMAIKLIRQVFMSQVLDLRHEFLLLGGGIVRDASVSFGATGNM